jgi:hypothetical protein
MNKKQLYNKRSRGLKLNENRKRKISKVRKIQSGGENPDFDNLVEDVTRFTNRLSNALSDQRVKSEPAREFAQHLLEQYGELNTDILNIQQNCIDSYNNLVERLSELYDEQSGLELRHIEATPEEKEKEWQRHLQILHERANPNIPSDQRLLIFPGMQPGQTESNTIYLERK